jgi:hypothetical protein
MRSFVGGHVLLLRHVTPCGMCKHNGQQKEALLPLLNIQLRSDSRNVRLHGLHMSIE